jgi:formylglycine-generating enzyme required for sulfatase activity
MFNDPTAASACRPHALADALMWLVGAWFGAALSIGAAAAQSCDGAEVEIGAGERQCFKPGAGRSFRDCPDCPEMVIVPAGSFTMGAPTAEEVAIEREDEVRVTISQPFAVGRFAVTRGEFAAFIAATGHKTNGDCYRLTGTRWKREEGADWRSPGFAQNDRHPVVCVSWHDARAYAAWLSALTGRSYRLLSETEREYVTRAGSTTPFWWGARISTDLANYDGTIAYGSGAQGNGETERFPSTVFPPMAGGSTTCMATCGTGSTTAGMKRMPATRGTVRQGTAATAAFAFRGAHPGTMPRTRFARRDASGTRLIFAAASSASALRGA